MAKRIFKILLTVFLALFVLSGVLMVVLRYPTVQTWLAQKATSVLSNRLHTKVSIERVEISFFNKADLVNFYLEDLNKDTLIAAGSLQIKFRLFSLLDKNISVSKIGLDGAVVHLHRDSTGKHMNLTDLFKSSQTTKPVADTAIKPFTWNINLDELALTKTDFRYLDEKSHTDVKVFVPSLSMDLKSVSINNKKIAVRSAVIDGADVSVDLLKRPMGPPDDSIMHVQFMVGGLQVNFEKFALTNTHFRLTDHNNDTILPKGIDFKHLDITGINLLAENGSVEGDSVVAQVTKLTAKDRSGFELKNLTTTARVSVTDITLKNLDLLTANSHIKDYLSFQFSAFHDFKNFLNAVRINADLKTSKVSFKDLNYFIRKLDKVEHNTLTITGNIEGRINNLKARNFDIKGGKSTVFKGDFYARGLPDIYETSLNLKVDRVATTVADIQQFYSGLKIPTNINSLGLIYYSGRLDGFLTDFVSNGKLVTAIGSATTDVNFKYDKKKNKSAYKGNLSLNNFDLSKFFNDTTNMGKVSLTTKINGGGLTLESLHAELDGNVNSIVLKNYEYKDIKIDGFVIRKSFNGLLQIHDQYLDMDFNGRADLSKETPQFKFDANIQRALLKELNLSKSDFRISGKLKSDFIGSKIDDILGSINLKDVVLKRDTVTARIKYLNLDTKLLSNQKKEIKLNSDFAEAELEGNFTVKELPGALLTFAKYTFTKDYQDTSHISPQNFSVDARIFEPGSLTQIIHPKFFLIRNSHIQGNFNSVAHQVNITASIPEIRFADYNVRRIDLKTHFENGTFNFATTVDKVYNADSLMMDTVSIVSRTMENKDVYFNVLVTDKKKYNYANITAMLTPLKGQALIRLSPSDVKLANYNWHFDENNSILVDGKKVTTQNLVFRSSDEAIYINSYLKNDTSTSIKLTLDNTDISDFTGIFTQKIKDMHGAMNGKLVVEDIFYKPLIFADVVLNEFTIGKELVGDINVESRLDETGKKILLYASVKSSNLNPDYRNFIEASGYISIDAANPGLKIDLDAPKIGLNFLNYRFFEKYVKNCRGFATAKASVVGTLKKPIILGEVNLYKDTVTVSFLNTTYHINSLSAKLDEHGFNFGNFTIYDIRDSSIYGSGRINHESFKQFALDLKVTTPNGQFINTTEKESPGFYGVAYGKGNVTFSGPISSPIIKAYALTKPGTYCKLPINSSYEINRYGFYKFVDHEPKTSAAIINPSLKLNGVNFTLEIDATPDARMDIVLDPTAGDVLTTYGRGNLKIEIPKNGNTTMYGTYEIERGSYLFTLQNIVNKRFEINKGSSINFTGEVSKATLNVNALYEVRSSVSDLIDDLINNGTSTTNTGTSQNQLAATARSRIPIKLMLNLTGILEKPTIAFDIKALDPDPTIKSYVEQKLALLKSNENEMNKQVFGLLVMNRFLPAPSTTATTSVGNYIGGTAANTVSEFLSSQLNNYLNNLLSYTGNDALKNLDINIGYRQYDQTTVQTDANGNILPTTNDTRRELKLALEQRLLNNRLTINAGGNLDFGNSTVVEGSNGGSKAVIPTGDFQIQYALTPDGRWSAKAFNRTNYDYYNSRNTNRTGIGLSYRQEFDKPSELFVRKKKKSSKKKEAGKPTESPR